MSEPEIKNDNPLYRLLREGRMKEFNDAVERGETADMTSCDFRGVDLRNMLTTNIDFSHCYFRQADLRGIDFTSSNLEGASVHAAKISGAYFPKGLSANEITLSLLHGTRMRYSDT